MSRRRICWPDPDATCLEGGCLHCQDARPQREIKIARYAQRAGRLPNRNHATGDEDAWFAYLYGCKLQNIEPITSL